MDELFKKDPHLMNVATSSPAEAKLKIEYSDEDLVLIDNVKLLVAPHSSRLQMNIIAFCIKGKIQAEMNGKPFTFGMNQILICPANVLFTNFMMTPDFEFKALFISNRMLQNILREKMNSWTNLLYVKKHHLAMLGNKDIEFLVQFYEMLMFIINNTGNNPYKAETMESFLRGGFIGVLGFLMTQVEKQNPTAMPTERKSSEVIFHKFLDILGNSDIKYHTVEYYAQKLCVTAKSLTVFCKVNSGKTANEWIREYVLEDIRYYLLQTSMSNKQICAQLGFPNPSFFGRYVKEHFGKPPSQLRKSYGENAQ